MKLCFIALGFASESQAWPNAVRVGGTQNNLSFLSLSLVYIDNVNL